MRKQILSLCLFVFYRLPIVEESTSYSVLAVWHNLFNKDAFPHTGRLVP